MLGQRNQVPPFAEQGEQAFCSCDDAIPSFRVGVGGNRDQLKSGIEIAGLPWRRTASSKARTTSRAVIRRPTTMSMQ